jgi:hypothetical protein
VELPVRIRRAPGPQPVISVDGAWDAPGLNLSHWPGNRTPRELRHDLTTGVALRFARLSPERRAELASGCVAIVNNHYDTDGSCALFAVRHPSRALALEPALLDAAAAGDFYRLPSERAFCVDSIVHGLGDAERSPLALAGLDELARHQAATDLLMDQLPAVLEGDLEPWRSLWEEPLAGLRADLAALEACERDSVAHLDWAVYAARGPAADSLDPCRHALLGTTRSDRVLFLAETPAGTRCRLVIGTLSWFDLDSRAREPRPRLGELAERLNELEGSDPEGVCAWRAQDIESPSPELWFGLAEQDLFADRCPALRPSRIDPARLRREIADSLRAAAPLPS